MPKPTSRLQPSLIKNKIKREEVSRKNKKNKRQEKLQKRLARAKLEATDPLVKKKRLAENVPRTLDNTREFDPSTLTVAPSASQSNQSHSACGASTSDSGEAATDELVLDISSDPFASYFSPAFDANPSLPPKVLITTSFKSSKLTYEFCDELVNVIPGSEFIRRKKGKDFEMGRIAIWAAERGYGNMVVVNEDTKKPNAITLIHLPQGPTAYFKLSSVQSMKQISGHARPTEHFPELVLNNFVTRLGHTVGRMFQTLFPPMPEFQGRQVVTLHNQRDFLFFRRHRYAFRSPEKAVLQEIGPRFTLKLRWVKKGTPSIHSFSRPSESLELGQDDDDESESRQDVVTNLSEMPSSDGRSKRKQVSTPSTKEEYIWMWKPELEMTRRTFFL